MSEVGVRLVSTSAFVQELSLPTAGGDGPTGRMLGNGVLMAVSLSFDSVFWWRGKFPSLYLVRRSQVGVGGIPVPVKARCELD